MNVAPGYFQRKIEENIEPKEIPSCFIPFLLVVFTWQLEILVTTILQVVTTLGTMATKILVLAT